MPGVAIRESSIVFPSNEAISSFKHECQCNDFYIDRDAMTLVGFFTDEQIKLATEKFEAVVKAKP
jgi:hypothetical protein